MTTAITEDLSWVEFSEETADPCTVPECSMEALYLMFWKAGCDHVPNPFVACAGHKEIYVSNSHWRSEWKCGVEPDCHEPWELIRVEPIRRG